MIGIAIIIVIQTECSDANGVNALINTEKMNVFGNGQADTYNRLEESDGNAVVPGRGT